MKSFNEMEVREWIWRRQPCYKIATLEYNDVLHMWIAVILANPSCVDRLYIDVDEYDNLSLWEHECCRWETIYHRGAE